MLPDISLSQKQQADSDQAKFSQFLRELDVETIPTDMSFGVSKYNGELEWGSSSLLAFFGKLSHLLRPFYWRLIFDILRFNFFAPDILSSRGSDMASHRHPQPRDKDKNADEEQTESLNSQKDLSMESIGDYLTRQRYSKQFMEDYIIPMVAAPWCIEPGRVFDTFPAATLIHFM